MFYLFAARCDLSSRWRLNFLGIFFTKLYRHYYNTKPSITLHTSSCTYGLFVTDVWCCLRTYILSCTVRVFGFGFRGALRATCIKKFQPSQKILLCLISMVTARLSILYNARIVSCISNYTLFGLNGGTSSHHEIAKVSKCLRLKFYRAQKYLLWNVFLGASHHACET